MKRIFKYYKDWFEVLAGDESLVPAVSVESNPIS